MEKKYKMASYSKGWPIIKNNDNDVTIEFFLVTKKYRLKGQPRRNQRGYHRTDFLMKSPAILSEVGLSLWHLGIQNQEAFRLSPDNGADCWFKTKTLYHVQITWEL